MKNQAGVRYVKFHDDRDNLSSLNDAEKRFLRLFEHFGCVAGHRLSTNCIVAVQDKYLAPPDVRNMQEIIKSLVEKDCITPDLALTQIGEEHIYGVFSLENGVSEFMRIFRDSHCAAGHCLTPANIMAKLNLPSSPLSPLSKKHLEEIEACAIMEGYVTREDGEILRLTEKGERYLYS